MMFVLIWVGQVVMVWLLALVAVIGVGLPVAAWSITRWLPAPRTARKLGTGYDAIDRWLLDRYRLAWRERSRVRAAVFQGRQVADPMLAQAASALAAQVLAGRFRTLRLYRMLGWADLIVGAGYAVLAVVLFVTSQHAAGFVLAVLGVVNAAVLMAAGVMFAFRAPSQIRRNAQQALRAG